MERACFTFDIYPGKEDEYQRRHDEIWPEMLDALNDAGISNYTLFRRGTTIYAYAECEPDAATAFAKAGETDANQRWAEWFEDVIVDLTDESGELRWAEEVWHQE